MDKKENQPVGNIHKKQKHPRKKSDIENRLLYECVQVYLLTPNRSTNKEKICKFYSDELKSKGYDYDYKEVSAFVNNHKDKEIPPQYERNDLQPFPDKSDTVPTPPRQQTPQIPISPQQKISQSQSPVNDQNNHQSQTPPPPTQAKLDPNTPQEFQQSTNSIDDNSYSQNYFSPLSSGTSSNYPNFFSPVSSSSGLQIEPIDDSKQIEFNRPDINSNLNQSENDDSPEKEEEEEDAEYDAITEEEEEEEEEEKVKDDSKKVTASSKHPHVFGKKISRKSLVSVDYYSRKNMNSDDDEDEDDEFGSQPSVSEDGSSTNRCDALIDMLPVVPELPDDASELESFKDKCRECIRKIYKMIHMPENKFNGKGADDDRLMFQEACEERFVECSRKLLSVEENPSLPSLSVLCEKIELPKKFARISARAQSCDINGEKSGISKITQHSYNLFPDSSKNKGGVSFERLISKRSIKTVEDKMLVKLYNGDYFKENGSSQDYEDVEAATVIYANGSQPLEACVARAVFKDKAHVLQVKDAEINTGFFLPVTSLHFHHEKHTCKLFVSGDIRLKEFTFDMSDPATLTNTNTFYLGERMHSACAIAVWDDELAFGIGTSIYFWDLVGSEPKKETIESKRSLVEDQEDELDMGAVDWTRGKSYKARSTYKMGDSLKKISSLEVIRPNKSTKGRSFLAASFSEYPVIYIINKAKQIVSRLVSHTLGVTSLRVFNSQLVSGSFDHIAFVWDVKKGIPTIRCITNEQKITAIEDGAVCGHSLLFTGGDNGSVIGFDISMKIAFCVINLNRNVAVREIRLVTRKVARNKEEAKLVILSEYNESESALNSRKKINVQLFDLN